MTIFDERPFLPQTRRRPWLLVIPVLAAIGWAGLTLSHQTPHLQRALKQFRGEAAADSGPDLSMVSSLAVRRYLLLTPHPKLNAHQSMALNTSVLGPVDDQAQSEALDVLSLAKRADALSEEQTKQAQNAAILVLSRTPGPMVRLESARLLGHLGNLSSSPALQGLAHDSDSKVQAAAQEALGRIAKR